MRKELYKAIRKKDGKWINGIIIPFDLDSGYIYIMEPYPYASTISVENLIIDNMHLIEHRTACLFTGFSDKENNKIFENDVVLEIDSGITGFVKFGLYNDKHYGFYIEWNGDYYYRNDIYYWVKNQRIKVVGNFFDNYDLLKECD